MADMENGGFDDAALRTAQLVIDPYSVEGLCLSPPAEGAVIKIDGEYHVPDEADPLRCCLCPQHTPHRNGFVIVADGAARHLIGSTCGPKHLGITFRTAKNQHQDRLNRQGSLHRLDAVLERYDAFRDQCDGVLFSTLFKSLQERSAQFEAAAGDATVRLRSFLLRGAPLTENVSVRDFAAEERREDDKDKTPIYKREPRSVGMLAGGGFLHVERLRETVFAFKNGLRTLKQAVAGGTATISTKRLATMLKELSDAHGAANAAIASINGAPAFFSMDNLDRLERWSHEGATQKVSWAEGGLEIRASGKAQVIVTTPEGDKVAPLALFPA